MDIDLEVYSYDQLGDQGDQNLLALLDEGDADLDALTFGLEDDNDQQAFGDSVGRDFDFSGSTNAFLGTASAQQAGLKSAPSAWLGGAAQEASSTPAARSLSPWTSLNDDPLLSGRAPPPVPIVQQQQHQQPQRAFKTLEEVEAELRQQQQQQQRQALPPAAAAPLPPTAGMTLEQVEAEMARQRQAAVVAQQTQQVSPQFQQQQQQQQSPFPQPQHLPPHQQQQFPPGFPPQGFPPGYPPQGLPPHLLPPHLRAQFPNGLPPAPGFHPLPPGVSPQMAPQFLPPHAHSRPGSVVPGGLGGPPGSAQNSPALLRQHLPPALLQQQQQQQQPQHPGQGPPTPGPHFPPLGAQGQLQSGAPIDLMATLFPPLPSAASAAPPPVPQTIEQQLHFLTLASERGTQHPSLTAAGLQALLQQVQAQVGEKKEGEEEDKGEEGEARRRAAEELIVKVEMRIREHEKAEEGRKRKAAKIASMAKHNNLMSNSDKDFITRIQVSQLVTDDPYADDFYFHIMAAIKVSRGLPVPGMMMPPPPPPGPGPGPGQMQQQMQQQQQGGNANNNNNNNNNNNRRRNNGRQNAMDRMAQNVQRLVDSAKKRNEKAGGGGAGGHLALDGALGKIATRTRSAPRPLLQVKPTTSLLPGGGVPPNSSAVSASAAAESKEGPSTGQSLLKGAGLITTPATSSPSAPQNEFSTPAGPLSYRSTLAIVEKIYDCVLDLEQLRRIQPQLQATVGGLEMQREQMVEGEVKEQMGQRVEEAKAAVGQAQAKEAELREKLWSEMRVMEALDACTPHPFISLLSVTKGKRILPRAIRHLTPEQTLTLLTLLVATFDTLDVVQEAPELDVLPSTSGANPAKRQQVADKTEALLSALISPVMAVIGQAPLRMVTGMLGLLMDRNDLNKVVRSKPGLAFLTILLSRAEGIKQAHLAAVAAAAEPTADGSAPTPLPQAAEMEADLATWHRTFTHLFAVLSSPNALSPSAPLLALFPSTRLLASLPFGFLASTSAFSSRPESDGDDEPVWRFLASLAVCADPEQQQGLVMGVRDKVVENVRAARQAEAGATKGLGQEAAVVKIRNVNLLLHALSLDASMIETDD